MPDNGCTKCVIDTGMGVNAARMYGRALGRVEGFRPVDYEAADFYADVLADCYVVVDMLWDRLKSDQRANVLVQIDKACYRADELIKWTNSLPHTSPDRVANWTLAIMQWAKDDQTFYTALSKETE